MPSSSNPNTSAVFSNATQTNGVVIASRFDSSNYPYFLFNWVSNNKWYINANSGWIVYKFANNDRWAVTSYQLRGTDSLGRDPRVWTIQGSNDLRGNDAAAVMAATWVDVDSQSRPGTLSGGTTTWALSPVFDCSWNETAYNAYRLNISVPDSGSQLALGEWRMFGDSGSAQLWQHAPTGAGHFSVTLNGWFDNHVNRPFDFWVLCGTVDHGANFVAWQAAGAATKVPGPQTPQATGAFSIPIGGLKPNTAHIARVYAVSGAAEAWSEPQTFFTFDAQSIGVRPLPANNVTDSAAFARGELVYTGGGNADVLLWWGTQNGAETGVWDFDEDLGSLPVGEFSFPLASLAPNTTYYYCFTASNTLGPAESSVMSFTTRGAPEFGAVGASVFSDAARLRASLVDAGETAARVSLWFGGDPSGLALAVEWPATAVPQNYAEFAGGLTPGATYYYAFMASNTVSGAAVVAWTQTNAFTVANRTLIWDNQSGNGKWDATSANWRPTAGASGGTAVFRQGDNAAFSLATATATLAGGVDAERVAITQTLTLGGVDELWFLRTLTVENAATANLAAPRLAGPGGMFVTNGTLTVGNAANSFAGGVTVARGTLNAALDSPSSTALGTGGVALGQDAFVAATAAFNTTGSGAVTTPGALTANGVFYNGVVNLANNTAATFGSLVQTSPGGTIKLTLNNATTSQLYFGNEPTGVLPPWFVISGSNGDYAMRGANGLVTRASTTDLANSGFAYYASGATVSSPASGAAAFMAGNLTLSDTLALTGVNGAAGLLMRGHLYANPGGALDLRGNDLYVYVEGAGRQFHAPVINPGGNLFAFGKNRVRFCTGALPPRIIVQEDNTEFGGADFTYNGKIYAFGDIYKTDNTAITLRGRDGFLLNANSVCVNASSGTLTLADGDATIRNQLIVYNSAALVVTNVTANITSTGSNRFVIGGNGASLRVLTNSVVDIYGCANFGNNNQSGSFHVTIDGGGFETRNWIAFGSQASSTVCVTNGGYFKCATDFDINTGHGHEIIVNGGTFQVSRRFGFGTSENSTGNKLTVANSGHFLLTGGGLNLNIAGGHLIRLESNGRLEISGNNDISLGGADNRLVPAGGAVTARDLTIQPGNILAPEIQPQGFGVKDGLGEIALRGTATFNAGSILRPTAAKDAPPGTYRILTAPTITNNGLVFKDDARGGKWDWWIDTKTSPQALYVKFSKIGTILMIK